MSRHLSVVKPQPIEPNGQLTRVKYVPLKGLVYCHEHGLVHDDTLDPYREGVESCLANDMTGDGRASVHRAVYARFVKGDWYDPNED